MPGKPDIMGFPGIDTKTALRFGRLFLYERLFLNMVEMAGIEPASEKGLPRLSTSVAFVLEFPLPPAQKQARGFGSP